MKNLLVQLVRWLVFSGAGIRALRSSTHLLATKHNKQLIRAAVILLILGWLVTIGDLLLPIPSLPPVGLLIFIFAGIVSVVANIASSVFAGNLILRRVNGNRTHPGSHQGHTITGGMLIFAAVVSVAAERVLALIAAIHG
jgi:hypothetical protein